MKHRDYMFISKILSEISIGIKFIDCINQEIFLKDEILKRAACMTAINVGELVKGLTDETTKKYNNVPWRKIAGFRDIAAHRYEALNMADVYDVIKQDYPILEKNLKEILDNEIDEKI